MKNVRVLPVLCLFLLLSCKDELNLPVYDSYVDGDGPTFEIRFPKPDTTLIGKDSITFDIICRDNYEIDNFTFEIEPTDFSSERFTFNTAINDTFYHFNETYPLPTKDSMRYEVYVKAVDLVGNSENTLFFITVK